MSTAPWFRAARSAATCKRLRNQPLFSWPARRSRLWHGGAGGAPSRVRPCDISKGHDVHKASCDPVRAAALPVIRETAGQKKWLSGLGASGDGASGDGASGDRRNVPRVLVAGTVNVPSERPSVPVFPTVVKPLSGQPAAASATDPFSEAPAEVHGKNPRGWSVIT